MKLYLKVTVTTVVLFAIIWGTSSWMKMSNTLDIKHEGEIVAPENYEQLKSHNNDEISTNMWDTMLDYVEIEHPGEVENPIDREELKSYHNNNSLSPTMWDTLLDNLATISCEPIILDANCNTTGLIVNGHTYTIPTMDH
jgi:hypothetical protein